MIKFSWRSKLELNKEIAKINCLELLYWQVKLHDSGKLSLIMDYKFDILISIHYNKI